MKKEMAHALMTVVCFYGGCAAMVVGGFLIGKITGTLITGIVLFILAWGSNEARKEAAKKDESGVQGE